MPNWCSSCYCFDGPPVLIDHFEEHIIEFTSTTRVKNGFGNNWLGNIVDGFGIDWEKVHCRGEMSFICKDEDGLFVDTFTAWVPMPEMWDAIIEKHYSDTSGRPLINYVYISEEPGCCLYINTDDTGEIFRSRYILDDFEEDVSYYSADETEILISELNGYLKEEGLHITDITEAESAVDKYNELSEKQLLFAEFEKE